MSVPPLPVNPGAGIEDQALVEIAPAPCATPPPKPRGCPRSDSLRKAPRSPGGGGACEPRARRHLTWRFKIIGPGRGGASRLPTVNTNSRRTAALVCLVTRKSVMAHGAIVSTRMCTRREGAGGRRGLCAVPSLASSSFPSLLPLPQSRTDSRSARPQQNHASVRCGGLALRRRYRGRSTVGWPKMVERESSLIRLKVVAGSSPKLVASSATRATCRCSMSTRGSGCRHVYTKSS